MLSKVEVEDEYIFH